jgi:Uma2 family endonuclease
MVALPFPVDRPWKIEDLAEMPDDGQRYELLQGELFVSPAPGGNHQLVLGELHGHFFILLKKHPVGRAVVAPCDVRLSPNDLVQPDLIFFRNEQIEQFSNKSFSGAPAFVIEVISPSTGSYDRGRKAALYMQWGVEEYWIVDPDKKRILVHTAAEYTSMPRIVTSGIIVSSVVPEYTIDLVELFAVSI